MTYTYRLLPDGSGYVDAEGVHRGVPPTGEDFDRIALYHRMVFGPYDAEFTKELPIEEVKKRYPNATIPGEEKK